MNGCDDILLLSRFFTMRTLCTSGVGVLIRWWDVENLVVPRGKCLKSNIVAMRINDFDESQHWWWMVVMTNFCCVDFSPCQPSVPLVMISWSGDEMLKIWWHLGRSALQPISQLWALMISMNVFTDDVWLWWRAVVESTCDYGYYMGIWCRCLDSVMRCRKYDGLK